MARGIERGEYSGMAGFKPDCTRLTASFSYDALGRRIAKTIDGRTIKYLYDGLDIVQEVENGSVTDNYIRTLNIDEPLARIKADGTVRYYHADALGSVIALTDENAVVKTTYSYDPFGNVTVSGEASDNPFQYTGRENDGTGLYYYRARYYSPELQRFISEDPIRLAGGINLFAYVGNSPLNRIDPRGLAGCIGGCHPGFPPSPPTGDKSDSDKCGCKRPFYCWVFNELDKIECALLYADQPDLQTQCVKDANDRKKVCCETGNYPPRKDSHLYD